MKKLSINYKFSRIKVKIISVTKEEDYEFTGEECYEIVTDISTIYIFGDTGRNDAKILKEEFEGKDKKAILHGCFHEGFILPHPFLPFVVNATKDEKDEKNHSNILFVKD